METYVRKRGWDDVRFAAQECRVAACKWGGWWTLGKTAEGTFIRYGRYRHIRDVTPLLHMCMTAEPTPGAVHGYEYVLKLERAYYGANDIRP